MEQSVTVENRRKSQRNGEEDPIVIAQRFLNIYRQIHIFNSQKKSEFNKMLLELSPQVRGMFGQLPGGALLQEYVDELTEQDGAERSPAADHDFIDENTRQTQILANAMAEAQASVQIPPKGVQQVAFTTSAAPVSGSSQLIMDKNFAQDLANALAAAMGTKNKDQETKIEKIIDSFSLSQKELLKLIQSDSNINQKEMQKISQALIQAQYNMAKSSENNKLGEETKQIIRIILEGQKQTIEKLAKVEAMAMQKSTLPDMALAIKQSEKTFGKLFIALHEKQKNNIDTIAKMLIHSQQNMAKLLIQHNNVNQNSGNASAANNIQINSSDYSEVLGRIADKLDKLQLKSNPPQINVKFPKDVLGDIIKAQQELTKKQNDDFSRIIVSAIKECQEASTQNIIDALAQKRHVAITPLSDYSQETNVISSSDEQIAQDETNNFSFNNELLETENTIVTTNDVLEETSPKKKKKKKKKKKNNTGPNEIEEAAFSKNEDDIIANTDIEVTPVSVKNDMNHTTISGNNDVEPLMEDSDSVITEHHANEEMTNSDEVYIDEDYDFKKLSYDADKNTNLWDFETADIAPITDFDTADDWGFSTSPAPEDSVSSGTSVDGDDSTKYDEYEWEYIEEEVSETNVHNQTLSLLNENTSLWSGDLFFQPLASNSAFPSSRGYVPFLTNSPRIVDSIKTEDDIDPYKISSQKD